MSFRLYTDRADYHSQSPECPFPLIPLAKGFYEHMVFDIYKRTELDEQGKPCLLLYMKRDCQIQFEFVDKSVCWLEGFVF